MLKSPMTSVLKHNTCFLCRTSNFIKTGSSEFSIIKYTDVTGYLGSNSGLSTSSGKFTAPKAGDYQFMIQALKVSFFFNLPLKTTPQKTQMNKSNTLKNMFSFFLQRNGKDCAIKIKKDDVVISKLVVDASSGSDTDSVTGTVIVRLNVNDKVSGDLL